MRKQDTITIAEFGNFIIEAEYDYFIETLYPNKHGPVSASDIRVEKIELHIKRMRSKRIPGTKEYKHIYYPVSTIRLLDIPPWLWAILNDEEVLSELDLDTGPDEPPDDRDQERAVTANDERDYQD